MAKKKCKRHGWNKAHTKCLKRARKAKRSSGKKRCAHGKLKHPIGRRRCKKA